VTTKLDTFETIQVYFGDWEDRNIEKYKCYHTLPLKDLRIQMYKGGERLSGFTSDHVHWAIDIRDNTYGWITEEEYYRLLAILHGG